METHPYYGPGNVVIDSCCGCGCGYVWLDHGELATLARAGGRTMHQSTVPEQYPTMPPELLPTTDRDESPLEALFDMLF